MTRDEKARALWLDERRKGIGGSDMADLFELPELGGCQRRLWYDKTNTPPDVPRLPLLVMRRGQALEALAAAEYKRKHPTRPVVRLKEPYTLDAFVWARSNVDRRINERTGKKARGCAPLEIKTCGHFVFRKVKVQGMSQAHILQLQHAILCMGARWGAFMVLHPDSWESIDFDVARDEKLIDLITERGEAFWSLVLQATPPEPPYEPGHKACRSCAWRFKCHGAHANLLGIEAKDMDIEQAPAELAVEFTELLVDYATAKKAVDDAEATLELIRAEIKATLGARQAVQCEAGRVYYRPSERRTLDVSAVRANHPAIYDAYTRLGTVRALRVYTYGED